MPQQVFYSDQAPLCAVARFEKLWMGLHGISYFSCLPTRTNATDMLLALLGLYTDGRLSAMRMSSSIKIPESFALFSSNCILSIRYINNRPLQNSSQCSGWTLASSQLQHNNTLFLKLADSANSARITLQSASMPAPFQFPNQC